MKESQIKMLPHSAAKVTLLKRYLERYLSVLTNTAYIPQIYLYDLFCGEGVYEGGNGSPIIFLNTIKEVIELNKQNGRRNPEFVCRFNDINKEKITRLKAHIEKEGLDKPENVTIIYSNEDYHDALSQTVDEIAKFKSQKAFVFIDPYGYKEVRISDIKRLLETTKSEVLLFLPTQFMFRFEAKGTPESLIEFITELMPREKWPKSETGIDFIENLTDAFRNTLPEKFVDSFIITRERNQYFCLFFFTSHIYGFDRMLDAKWKIDEEDGRGWQYEDTNNLFAQVEKQPNTIKFEKNLSSFLKQPRSNSEVYEFTLHQGHLPTHAYQILMKWQGDGQLSLKKPDDTEGRKSSFYIDYKNYQVNRVTIKLK